MAVNSVLSVVCLQAFVGSPLAAWPLFICENL